MNLNFLPILSVFVAAALAPTASADTESVKREVLCAETAFSRAAEARDLSAFLALVDPDARFASNTVARGKEQIAEVWAGFFAADGPVIRWRPSVTEVSADGKLALSRGPFRITGSASDGNPGETWGHFISTWRKTAAGDWRVLFDSGGDAGMTPSEADVEVLASEPDCL
jgi:ketosteroid isomerase-like protein